MDKDHLASLGSQRRLTFSRGRRRALKDKEEFDHAKTIWNGIPGLGGRGRNDGNHGGGGDRR